MPDELANILTAILRALIPLFLFSALALWLSVRWLRDQIKERNLRMIDHTACCLTVSVVCFLISLLYLSLTILLYVPQAFAPSAAAVWLILAFFAFRHRASWSGKLLFAAAMLWSATLSIPMILFLEWKPWRACCAVMGMSASLLLLGRFVLWVRKQLRAARERRQKKQSPR